MNPDVVRLQRLVRAELAAVADPAKAPGMQAYMKTDMPFYGVQKAGRTPILRRISEEFRPTDATGYEALVASLWELPHREEKYLALGVARHFKVFIVPDRLPLYRHLIVDGAWWDFVDEIATNLIRHLVIEYPEATWPVVDTWVDDDDMWLRRTSIICQIGAKEETDPARLFAFCSRRLGETEFFIRKAIGWSLREYAKTDATAVANFVNIHRADMSGLSFREATKHIDHMIAS